jgi:hypothetical protein
MSILACKPKSAQIKSLDDLAAGGRLRLQGNLCSGDPNAPVSKYAGLNNIKMLVDVADPAVKKGLEGVVAASMSALPASYIDALAALDAKVLVTPNSDSFCKIGAESAGPLSGLFITACSVTINPGMLPKYPQFEGITLVMASNAEMIRHNMIRVVGQLFSQVFAQRLEARSIDGRFTFSQRDFVSREVNLAAAFLQDVSDSKLFKVETLEPLLGSNLKSRLNSVMPQFEAGKIKDPFAAMRIDEAKLAQFLTHVTSNSFDSYYCRSYDNSTKAFDPANVAAAKKGDRAALAKLTNTRKVFETFFPRTHARYKAVDEYMAKLASEIAALKPKGKAALTGETHLALTGKDGFWSRVGNSISNGLYIAKEGFVGLGQGAVNIYEGTTTAASNLASGVSGLASTAYNEGIGAAASQVGSSISHHSHEAYQNVMRDAEAIGSAYGNGQIGLGTAAGRLVLSAGSNTPIIGNAGKTLNNAWDVATESDLSGQRLTFEQQQEIARRQGQVAGNAVVEAGSAYGAEVGGQVIARGVSAASNAGAQGLVRGTGYVAEALGSNEAALSGFGQAVMRGSERAAFSLEQSFVNSGKLVGHTAQHNIASAVHVAASEGIVTPSVQGAYSGAGHHEDKDKHGDH